MPPRRKVLAQEINNGTEVKNVLKKRAANPKHAGSQFQVAEKKRPRETPPSEIVQAVQNSKTKSNNTSER